MMLSPTFTVMLEPVAVSATPSLHPYWHTII
uniref:Uncharacterized protein n=1 Tax=Anguilla anguilla TaxID=7936 RepID=A0A0E9SLS3_ANGAN